MAQVLKRGTKTRRAPIKIQPDHHYILHGHGRYGTRGRASYVVIDGHKDKKVATAMAKSWPYGDVVDDHRIVKGSRIRPVVHKGKRVESLYEVKSLL